MKYKVDSDIKIGKELQDAIRKTSESQNKVIINSTNEIIGSLEKNLDSINRAIIDSSSEIRSELKRGNELQRIENIINSNIAELLKIPDSRKELQALIEEGFQHYSNAFHEEEDPDFLLEAALIKFLC